MSCDRTVIFHVEDFDFDVLIVASAIYRHLATYGVYLSFPDICIVHSLNGGNIQSTLPATRKRPSRSYYVRSSSLSFCSVISASLAQPRLYI